MIPSGRTAGGSVGIGGVGGVVGGADLILNYDSGQISASVFGGAQLVGWNGAMSASANLGFAYGLLPSNSNYGGGATSVSGSGGIGGFATWSSGGLTGAPVRNPVKVVGVSAGGSLVGGVTGGVTRVNYSTPLPLGKFWAFTPADFAIYAARKLCQ